MTRAVRRGWLVAVLVGVAVAAPPTAASAHPFGPPTSVTVAVDGADLELRWRAAPDDVALLGGALGVLPERREIVIEPDGSVAADGVGEMASSPELADYLERTVVVHQDGRPCPSAADVTEMLEEGARIAVRCPRDVAVVDVEVTALTDVHEAYRTVVIAPDGGGPARTLHTRESPVHTIRVGATDEADGGGAALAAARPATGGPEATLLARMDAGTPLMALLAIALVVGVAHGLAPGHGKSIGAAHLVGRHATVGHAAALAAAVAVMHTASVGVLAAAWWVTAGTDQLAVDRVTAWGQFAVALLIAFVGARLVHLRWRTRHEHGHAHGHAAPWTRKGLLAVAAAGGLLPSPTAFLVLVTGMATARAGTAMAAVALFGIGLGTTVFTVGLMTLRGRDLLQRAGRRHRRIAAWAHVVPLVGAAAVTLGGAVAVVLAIRDLTA